MANFKIVTQKSPKLDFLASDQTYSLEMESLNTVGAEIMEVDATSEDEFIKEARYADALIARGRRITKKIINELENCKVIALGSVGADSVDIEAATKRNIPVTNVPDVFIEEKSSKLFFLILPLEVAKII